MVLNRRNAIYRYIILAIAGLTAIAASPSKQGNAQPQSVKAKQNVINKPTSLNLTLPKDLVAPTKDQGCKRGRDNPKSDLCAQWKAADAARDAADWAWWQLGLSAVGVLGLGATLWFNFRGLKLAEGASAETRDALAIAERNAEAASSLVRVAEDTAHRQLRAYITVFEVNIEIDPGDPGKILVTAKLINQGQTPAIDVQSCLYTSVTQGSDIPRTLIEHPIPHAGSTLILESGGKREISHSSEVAIPPSDAMTGDYTVCAYGWVRYQDIFGFNHETRHCHLTSNVTRLAGRPIAVAPVGNSMT